MREFFALPLAEKRAVERTATNAWGFYDRELTKNVRDGSRSSTSVRLWRGTPRGQRAAMACVAPGLPADRAGLLQGVRAAGLPAPRRHQHQPRCARGPSVRGLRPGAHELPKAQLLSPLHRSGLTKLADDAGRRPFFFNPASEAIYAPLPRACDSAPPRYRPIRWGEFRAARAAGDYADCGEDIQIAHFRV
jgi:hypothetical protein